MKAAAEEKTDDLKAQSFTTFYSRWTIDQMTCSLQVQESHLHTVSQGAEGTVCSHQHKDPVLKGFP